MSLKAKMIGLVDIGNGNKKNDDRLMIGKKVYSIGKYEDYLEFPFHSAICDGVGSLKDGDKAAEFVLKKLTEKNLELVSDIDEMSCVLSDINDELSSFQKDNNVVDGMRTTLVGIGFYYNKVIYYNSGDSRLYRLRNGLLCKLSEDHSVAQEMIWNGVLTENFEEELMKCNRITRCMGEKDVLPPYINQINISAMNEDVYLLCSDGLWGVVTDNEIEMILRRNTSLEDRIDGLCKLANNNGGKDNISIAIIQIEQ